MSWKTYLPYGVDGVRYQRLDLNSEGIAWDTHRAKHGLVWIGQRNPKQNPGWRSDPTYPSVSGCSETRGEQPDN